MAEPLSPEAAEVATMERLAETTDATRPSDVTRAPATIPDDKKAEVDVLTGGGQPAPPRNDQLVRTGPVTPVAWDKALEPRTLGDARVLSRWMHASRLFMQFGAPEAVLAVILSGRELGLGQMASLRAFHVVEGRPTMAADFIRGLVLSSGKAEYFDCVQRSATAAKWVTKRVGSSREIELEYTLEEAKIAGLIKEKSGWQKHPADMLAKTASTKLARLVYPDVTFGLYAPTELGGDEL